MQLDIVCHFKTRKRLDIVTSTKDLDAYLSESFTAHQYFYPEALVLHYDTEIFFFLLHLKKYLSDI